VRFSPDGNKLLTVGGDKLGKTEEVIVRPIGPGEEIDISVDMISPSKPGKYISYWRMCNSSGHRYGHRLWAEILVIPPPQPDPQPIAKVPVPEQHQIEVREEKKEEPTIPEVPIKKEEQPTSQPFFSAQLPSFFSLLPPMLTFGQYHQTPEKKEEQHVDSSEKFIYEDELKQLEVMGFSDKDNNKKQLLAFQGNILDAVHALLDV